MARFYLRLRLGGADLAFGLSWLAVIPAGLWALATRGVPVFVSFSAPWQAWAVAGLTALLIAGSLLAHVLAHVVAARWQVGHAPVARPAAEPSVRDAAAPAAMPEVVPLYLFGDAAQVWQADAAPAREAMAAAAGPVANLVLAALAYLAWNVQVHPALNAAMPIVAIFNAGLAVANLAPAFPLDGGRLAALIATGLLRRPLLARRLPVRLGWLIVALLTGWAAALALQPAGLGPQTAGPTLAAAALFAAACLARSTRAKPAVPGETEPLPTAGLRRAPRSLWVRAATVALGWLLLAALLAAAASLLPLNLGLEAPGPALSVEPMVAVPPAYSRSHPGRGTFILTSVLQQAPITLGEWAYGQISRSVILLPAEEIIPPGTTPQEQARQGFRMLDESEVAASVVGLRLAGYPATAEGKGVRVEGILSTSPSRDLLQPGDVIVAFDDRPVQGTAMLLKEVATVAPGTTVRLGVERVGQPLVVTTAVMSPATPNGPPRLGLTVASAGLTYSLPFSVTITPQKIVGGPSAGLMFALTVCNALSPTDLTRGHRIAGTGTIDPDGTVGPIGGVEEKVLAAEAAGAEYFLVPRENYAAAATRAQRIKVVPVGTAAEAVAFLQGL